MFIYITFHNKVLPILKQNKYDLINYQNTFNIYKLLIIQYLINCQNTINIYKSLIIPYLRLRSTMNYMAFWELINCYITLSIRGRGRITILFSIYKN